MDLYWAIGGMFFLNNVWVCHINQLLPKLHFNSFQRVSQQYAPFITHHHRPGASCASPTVLLRPGGQEHNCSLLAGNHHPMSVGPSFEAPHQFWIEGNEWKIVEAWWSDYSSLKSSDFLYIVLQCYQFLAPNSHCQLHGHPKNCCLLALQWHGNKGFQLRK